RGCACLAWAEVPIQLRELLPREQRGSHGEAIVVELEANSPQPHLGGRELLGTTCPTPPAGVPFFFCPAFGVDQSGLPGAACYLSGLRFSRAVFKDCKS